MYAGRVRATRLAVAHRQFVEVRDGLAQGVGVRDLTAGGLADVATGVHDSYLICEVDPPEVQLTQGPHERRVQHRRLGGLRSQDDRQIERQAHALGRELPAEAQGTA